MIDEVIHKIAAEEEKVVITALLKGYDGVDIIDKSVTGFTPDSDPTLGFRSQMWNEDPPPRRPWGVRRYDFRYYDRERLIARVLREGYDIDSDEAEYGNSRD